MYWWWSLHQEFYNDSPFAPQWFFWWEGVGTPGSAVSFDWEAHKIPLFFNIAWHSCQAESYIKSKHPNKHPESKSESKSWILNTESHDTPRHRCICSCWLLSKRINISCTIKHWKFVRKDILMVVLQCRDDTAENSSKKIFSVWIWIKCVGSAVTWSTEWEWYVLLAYAKYMMSLS